MTKSSDLPVCAGIEPVELVIRWEPNLKQWYIEAWYDDNLLAWQSLPFLHRSAVKSVALGRIPIDEVFLPRGD